MVAWVLVRPGWVRILVVAACAPVFVAAANWTYLSALPSRFSDRAGHDTRSGRLEDCVHGTRYGGG